MSDEQLFPVDSYREAARHLRRPFTSAAVKFKPQTVTRSGKTICVSYIDARLAVERLNLVVPHLWQDEYEPLGSHLICRLTVDGITRQDVGEGQGKGLYSDALKRAAVKFGIGVSLYAVPSMILNGEVKQLYPDSREHAELRARYQRWLDEHGRQAFGDPLDHGDVDDAAGDPDETKVDPGTGEVVRGQEVPEPPPALTDEKAQQQIQQARDLYAQIRALHDGDGGRVITPGTFNAWVTAAHHSHERLEALIAHLQDRLEKLPAELEAA